MKDTIAAIASGMTASGIGIVRISGPEAFQVLERIFVFKNPKKTVANVPSGTVHYGHIYANAAAENVSRTHFTHDSKQNVLVSGAASQMQQRILLDEVLVLILKAPHTYTTEDTVEIDCHGGILVMQKIYAAVLAAGARPAEPGEFTKRAFLGGRIDLSEAEAVMDLIEARSETAMESSLSQLGGSLRRRIVALREVLITKTAFLEAALDDPEHYSLEGFSEELLRDLEPVRKELVRLRDSFAGGRLVREGILTVILGSPNVGKSSLLNLFSGTDRAIVTDIAGTTRDTLEETVRLGGISLRLADTAGIRNTDNIVEKIGVERAMALAKEAELLLLVLDASRELTGEEKELLRFAKEKKTIVLLNKSDLPPVLSAEMVENYDFCHSEEQGSQGMGIERSFQGIDMEQSTYGRALHRDREVQLNGLQKNGILRFAQNDSSSALGNNVFLQGHLRENTGKDFLVIPISAVTGEGMEALANAVRELFFSGNLVSNEDVYLTNVRHHAAVTEALQSLDLVFAAINDGVPEDFYTVDLMDAYASLGKIIGEEVGDDLVDTIFSKFCMGK